MGRHADVVVPLVDLVAAHPLRERFRAQLIVALYRCGRQADALQAYRDARELPARRARARSRARSCRPSSGPCSAHDPGARRADRARADRDRPGRPCPQPADVVRRPQRRAGRRSSTAIDVESADHRSSARAASARPGWCSSSAGGSPTSARSGSSSWRRSPTPARSPRRSPPALGAPERDGRRPAGRRARAACVDRLGERRTPSSSSTTASTSPRRRRRARWRCSPAARRCASWRRAASRSASRASGRSPSARSTTTTSAELFVERARAVQPHFGTTRDRRRARRAVPPPRRSAAGHRAGRGPGQDAAACPRSPTGCATASSCCGAPSATGTSRHDGLEAAIDWSYELLFDDERRTFRRLAVFAGGATIEAAERCAARTRSTLASRLVDRSLLVADTTGRVVRFAMLESLRAYGLDRLAETGELDDGPRRPPARGASSWPSGSTAEARGARPAGVARPPRRGARQHPRRARLRRRARPRLPPCGSSAPSSCRGGSGGGARRRATGSRRASPPGVDVGADDHRGRGAGAGLAGWSPSRRAGAGGRRRGRRASLHRRAGDRRGAPA